MVKTPVVVNQKQRKIVTSLNIMVVSDDCCTFSLHDLAKQGVVEIIDHPDVARFKDDKGMTPLHWLAILGIIEVVFHDQFRVVKDNDGLTPADYFFKN